MSDLPKIPAEAKEIIKHKRTGKIYASKEDFDADVADPNTDTTNDDFRQDLKNQNFYRLQNHLKVYLHC